MVHAAVTDTHPLLFYAAGSRRLGKKAATLFDGADQQRCIIYVPAAVIWESALLARIGRMDFQRSVRDFYAELFSNPAYQPVDLTPARIYLAADMRPNDDPFDPLICAAAQHLELPLITRDADIERSRLVKAIW